MIMILLAALGFLAQHETAKPVNPDRPFPLMIGDPAPPMPVKYYLRRDRPEKLEPGRPYVVDFWATWCVPCIAGFPHLTELQQKYKDKISIIAVSVWEPRPAEVPGFIDRQGDRMGFLAAMDDVPPAPADADNPSEWAKEHGKMSVSWLRASGADGIPTTFIVDSQNRIAWIGNPREMDAPLDAVVNGTWDTAAFAEAHLARMRLRAKAQPLQTKQFQARQRQDWASAVAALDELLALDPSFAYYAGTRFEVVLKGMKDSSRAYSFAQEAVSGISKNNANGLTHIARIIAGDSSPDRDLNLALAAALRAEALTHGRDCDTLAILARVHAAKGDFPKAVETQQRAIDQADSASEPELEKVLTDYRARLR